MNFVRSSIKRFPALKQSNFLKNAYMIATAFAKLPFAGFYDYIKAAFFPETNELAVIRLSPLHSIRLRNNKTDLLIFQQIFLLDDVAIPTSYKPETIIDGGAHIGLASIYFATRYPDSRIVAIEAEESNFRLLVKNTEAFAFITPVHAAISGSCGEVMISDSDAQAWGYQVTEKSEGSNGRQVVKSVTIDSVLSEHDWVSLDLLKLDIEGSEIEVFSSKFMEWLPKTKIINIELHDNLRSGCTDAVSSAVPLNEFAIEESVHNKIFIRTSLTR